MVDLSTFLQFNCVSLRAVTELTFPFPFCASHIILGQSRIQKISQGIIVFVLEIRCVVLSCLANAYHRAILQSSFYFKFCDRSH